MSRFDKNIEPGLFQPGRRVEFVSGHARVAGVVLVIKEAGTLGGIMRYRVSLRREGRTRAGHRYAIAFRWADQCFPLHGVDAFRANVFADWLEENGEIKAAELLRRRFPHSPRDGQ